MNKDLITQIVSQLPVALKAEYVHFAYQSLFSSMEALNESSETEALDFKPKSEFYKLELNEALEEYFRCIDIMIRAGINSGSIDEDELELITKNWVEIINPLNTDPYNIAIRDEDDPRGERTRGKQINLSKETIDTLIGQNKGSLKLSNVIDELKYESERLELQASVDTQAKTYAPIAFTNTELLAILVDLELNPTAYTQEQANNLRVKLSYMTSPCSNQNHVF